MPRYDFKNLKTGETKVLNLSLAKYEEWREDNPDWDKDWQAGCAADVAEVGDWRDKMSKTHPGWKDVIGRVAIVAGLCIISWISKVLFYKVYGHPWKALNGPSFLGKVTKDFEN